MIKLDGVCQGLHSPLLASATHHGLDLILKEAFEGIQWEDLIEARPACVVSGSVTQKNRRGRRQHAGGVKAQGFIRTKLVLEWHP